MCRPDFRTYGSRFSARRSGERFTGGSRLLALPAHALRSVLEDDAPPQQLVADAIGRGEVPLGARLRPAGDECLDLRIEGGALAGADSEDRLEGAHHLAGGLQVLPAERSRVDGGVRLTRSE